MPLSLPHLLHPACLAASPICLVWTCCALLAQLIGQGLIFFSVLSTTCQKWNPVWGSPCPLLHLLSVQFALFRLGLRSPFDDYSFHLASADRALGSSSFPGQLGKAGESLICDLRGSHCWLPRQDKSEGRGSGFKVSWGWPQPGCCRKTFLSRNLLLLSQDPREPLPPA